MPRATRSISTRGLRRARPAVKRRPAVSASTAATSIPKTSSLMERISGSSTTAPRTKCSSTPSRRAAGQLDHHHSAAAARPGSRLIRPMSATLDRRQRYRSRVSVQRGGQLANGGTKEADVSFALAAGNTNPQGIADPPAPTSGLSHVPIRHGLDADPSAIVVASDVSLVTTALLGPLPAARASVVQRTATVSRRLDEFMSSLGSAVEPIQRDTHLAHTTYSNTRHNTQRGPRVARRRTGRHN